MAEYWEFELVLSHPEREIALRQLRTLYSGTPPGSSVARVLTDLVGQVQEGDRIRLDLGGLDLYGMYHLADLLAKVSPPGRGGYTRCLHCGGSGEVKIPDQILALADKLERHRSLWVVPGPERAKYLDWPADKADRDRIHAERESERQRQRDSIRAQEGRTLPAPGTVVEDGPAVPAAPDFVPGGRLS